MRFLPPIFNLGTGLFSLVLTLAIGFHANAADVDFMSKPSVAGKVSLTNSSYYVNKVLDVANFSRELRLPVQMVYNSKVEKSGIFGYGWSCPQLESSAIPNKNGVIWTTPWGEKIQFTSKDNLNQETAQLYKEDLKGSGKYFAPYCDWEANAYSLKNKSAASGSWTFNGKGDYEGWQFVYRASKLVSVTAPSGYALEYVYEAGFLVAVRQNGVSFITLSYNDDELVDSMQINGVNYAMSYETDEVLILPKALKAKNSVASYDMLTSIRRGDLNPVTYGYNECGYLVSIRQGDSEEQLKVQVESSEQRRQNLQAAAGFEEERNGKKVKVAYNGVVTGRLVGDKDFTYKYPSRGAGKVTLVNKLGQTASYGLDENTGVYTQTGFNGKKNITTYYRRYDVAYMGKVRQVTDNQGRTVASYRYDKKSGKPVRVTDIAGNDINYSYDNQGNLTEVALRGADEDDAQPIVKLEYDRNGNPVKAAQLDESGRESVVTRAKYDDHNRPIKIENGQRSSNLSYNAYGNPVTTVDALGRQTKIAYDAYNRPLSITNPQGLVTEYTWNANGQLAGQQLKDGSETLRSVGISYDGNGQVVSRTDGQGRSKRVERDNSGRIAKEYDADGVGVQYGYDSLGNLTQVLDQNNNPITFEWNKHGLASRQTAAGQVTQYRYDSNGLLSDLVSKYSGNKEEDSHRKFEYDELDRLVKIDYGSGQTEQMEYDSWGRPVEKKYSDGKNAAYKRDRLGRIVEKREGNVTTSYEYNPWGQRTKRVVSNGSVTSTETREYDQYGRLTTLKSDANTITYTYDKNSRLSRQVVNGIPTEFTYDKLGQLIGKKMLSAQGKVLAELKYTYAADGTLTERELNGHKLTYLHDSKGQLISVMDGDVEVERYVYDAAGNIVSKMQGNRVTSYTYDKANQLLTKEMGDETTQYGYDAAGRMISEGDRQYHYGWQNKVIQITQGDEILGQYAYGADGQLASSTWQGQADTYLWDGLALVNRSGMEIVNDPAITGGNPLVAGDKVLFNDNLGSTLGAVKGEEFVAVGRNSFGQVEQLSGKTQGIDADFFTGKPYVEGLGYSFLYRNYRADLGKWQTSDPLGYPDGWNALAYCNNNTMGFVDPKGLAWKFVGENITSLNADNSYTGTFAGLGTTYGDYKVYGFDENGEASSVTIAIWVQTYNTRSGEYAYVGENITYTINEQTGEVSEMGQHGSATGMYTGAGFVPCRERFEGFEQIYINYSHIFFVEGGGLSIGAQVLNSGINASYSWSGGTSPNSKTLRYVLNKKNIE